MRQSLFTHEDCLNGGRPKAMAAAERALQICPYATVKGIKMHIPMPGHIIDNESEFVSAVDQLVTLVKEHDVIFLLTDSRESRWLPSLLGSVYDKIVITVALGFDSFVIMRHGSADSDIGCYFCNDINSPSDTMSGRTLDQQCTVTRPGLSYQASATAVELLASILQHPLKNHALPSPGNVAPTDSLPEGSSLLGLVPHQIRGFSSHFQSLILSGARFECCTACSTTVGKAYTDDGIDFLKRAMTDVDYLESVTGLTDLKEREHEKVEAFLEDLDIDDDF